MTDKMRALHSVVAGGPETLVLHDDVAVPDPGPGQVRIRAHAVSLNFPDVLMIQDRYQVRPPRPYAPGSEVAGVVDAIGAGVSGFHIGQRVMAVTSWGALADHVLAAASKVSPIPDTMPFDQASALLVTYATTWHALKHRGQLRAGETLLVLGASGGVGLAAVELGKAVGARVVAAASSQEKLAAARAAGADAVVQYPTGDLTGDQKRDLSAAFKAACGDQGASVVFDPVGGAYAEPAFRALGWQGRHLVIGFAAGIAALPMNLPLLKGASVVGVFWGESVERDPAGHQAAVAELAGLYQQGLIRPRVHLTLPLDRAAEGLALLQSRSAIGKIVVTL
ncbi:NADPH:quinone oxidoreductase family protein [Gemmobacter sp.]|uniref:NADPH:quinone oxidoreductase family protein n=1 Tax=Gemmobacter sp. TaxID=1898957 RepID=UPI002B003D3A|nr:NADPH:quinone oxidoreductase family protein [Gemmobacter sp.]